jgi:hypothetical protein
VCLPELPLLVAHLRCDFEVLRLDRSLLGLAHLLDPCSARLLGGLGLGTEGVDLPFELAVVYAEPAQRLAGERV